MDVNVLLSSLTSIGAIGKALIDERDSQKLATLKGELTKKIIDAQSQFMQLQDTVIKQQRTILALELRVRELEAAGAEKARYQLTKLGTGREFFVYALRPESELPEGTREVAHFLCQPCFDAGKKVVLTGNGEGYWKCPFCGHGAQTTSANSVEFSFGPPSRFDDF